MKKNKQYKSINVDLDDYQQNEKSILYGSTIGYFAIITFLLTLQVMSDFELVVKLILSAFILVIVYIEFKSSLNIRRRVIKNRRKRLHTLFDDKLNLDSEIYMNKVVREFDKNEIDKIVMINKLPYLSLENQYVRIHAIRYDNEWVEDLLSANQLTENHYAKLVSRELIEEIDVNDFSEFVNSNECFILTFYENKRN